jgi:hypothetical protein
MQDLFEVGLVAELMFVLAAYVCWFAFVTRGTIQTSARSGMSSGKWCVA